MAGHRSSMACLALLAVHAALLAWHGAAMSPVTTEIAHLPAGASHWKFGRFELFRQNPPLVRMVGALPVLAVGAEYDWSGYDASPFGRAEAGVGREFVVANGERTPWLFTLSRWAIIPFSLVGAWAAYRWAGELYGPAAGLVALSLYSFCPNLVGHGALLMPDAPSAAIGLAASYSFWKWLKAPSWDGAILAGLILGAAELTKTTLLALVPVWPVLWVLYRVSERRRLGAKGWLREAGMMIVRYAVAWYVLCSVYLFAGAFKPLGEYQFRSRALSGQEAKEQGASQPGNRFADTWLASLPVPLPADYVQGIDLQRDDFERKMFPSYLRGEWRNEGWWYYYLYVLAVKTPLGAIGLFAVAAFLSIWLPKAPLRDEVLLLAPAAAILILVSSQTGFSVHGRYVWPAIPYLYVFAGQAGRLVSRATPKSAALVIALAVASAGSMLWHCPHSVAYFNEAAGGPKNGAFHLHDSNVSWGQDLLHLKRWLDANPDARPFYLLAGNGIDPELAGIDYELPPFARPEPADGLPKRGVADEDNDANEGDRAQSQLPAGWYAIDVIQLSSSGQATYYGHKLQPSFIERCKAALRELATREPDAMAGYSIWIYHVPKENSNR